jgi:hypothetical protein
MKVVYNKRAYGHLYLMLMCESRGALLVKEQIPVLEKPWATEKREWLRDHEKLVHTIMAILSGRFVSNHEWVFLCQRPACKRVLADDISSGDIVAF